MLTKMSEKTRLKAMREGLFQAFPNPERKGCARQETIRAIVAGEMAIGEENKWVDHFAQCSPCSKEFFEIRNSHIRNQRLRSAAVAASAVLIVGLVAWGWVLHQQSGRRGNIVAEVSNANGIRQQVLDLRNWSDERTDGATEKMTDGPLELRRWRTSLVIYLPSGSKPGKYEIKILEGIQAVLDMDGVAQVEGENTVVRVRADLNSLKPGRYSLGIRQPPWDWRYLLINVQ